MKRPIDFTGAVSSGTLRLEDLIPTFMEVLQEYWPKRAAEILENYPEYANDPDFFEDEIAYFMLEDLSNSLEEIAPPEHTFGSHPGDDACIGFWPVSCFEF